MPNFKKKLYVLPHPFSPKSASFLFSLVNIIVIITVIFILINCYHLLPGSFLAVALVLLLLRILSPSLPPLHA